MKNKIFYFHIGLVKTGSTYLQQFIFNQFTDIYYTGYIPYWENKQENPINNYMNKIMYTSVMNIDFVEEKRKIEIFLKNIKQNKILISSEFLIGHISLNFINQNNIFEGLKKIFPNIKLILIIREQRSLLESYYGQTLIGYQFSSVDKVLNYNKKTNQFGGHKDVFSYGYNVDIRSLNYFNMYQALEKNFGKENILIMPFEELKNNKKKFFKNMCNFMGTDFNNIEIIKKKVNRSYSVFSSKIARIFNRFMRASYGDYGFIPERPFINFFIRMNKKYSIFRIFIKISNFFSLNGILNRIDKIYYKKPIFLTKEMKKIIYNYHNNSNKKLDILLNLDLNKYGYYDEYSNSD